MKTSTDWSKIIAEKDQAIAERDDKISELEGLVKFYEAQFRLNQHRRFGASSEKTEYDQPDIFNEAEATAVTNEHEPEPELELTEIVRHYRKRKRLVNDRLPEDLPVETIEHGLPTEEQICPDCNSSLHVMGCTSRRELVIIPAQVKIREYVTKTYTCRDCENTACDSPVPIIKAQAPASVPVIKGSFASPEAIAHIICQKFVMAVPLYRQEKDWERQGIRLTRQTMSNWLLRVTDDWLVPIYDALKDEMFANHDILHADETTLQVLKEPGKSPQSKSYMWIYRTSGYSLKGDKTKFPIVLYEYQPGRHAKYPAKFLQGFKGYLHADGYEGYHGLPRDITIVGCLQHASRKFDEALKSLPPDARKGSDAEKGKLYCTKLFALERSFREAELSPTEGFDKRQSQSKPLIDEFYAWLTTVRALPKMPLGVAKRYALDQRMYLERYLLDGRLEISNNRAERSIKPFVIGRKNFLFANTPRGARASAILYSIIETAKENWLNPYKYLTHIFKTAPNLDIRYNSNDISSLLPQNVPVECFAPGTLVMPV